MCKSYYLGQCGLPWQFASHARSHPHREYRSQWGCEWLQQKSLLLGKPAIHWCAYFSPSTHRSRFEAILSMEQKAAPDLQLIEGSHSAPQDYSTLTSPDLCTKAQPRFLFLKYLSLHDTFPGQAQRLQIVPERKGEAVLLQWEYPARR